MISATRLSQVDAFATGPFTGNPAAVCLLPGPRDAGWMQQVAAEMNLSETAFLVPREDGYSLRWFTPAVEVDLCGHATLASAHVLWSEGHLPAGEPARFYTKSGLLTCQQVADGGATWIWMDFPALPVSAAEPPPAGLAEALGVTPRWVGKSRFDVLVELASEAEVLAAAPRFDLLHHVEARGVVITAPAARPGIDFVSRFFGPRAGVNEDPVTGSAHCLLAPWWAQKLGKTDLTAYQASRRGGTVRLRVAGDRVKLGGQAVTVLRGEWVG